MKTHATSKVQNHHVQRQSTRKTAGGVVTRRRPALNQNKNSSSGHISHDKVSLGDTNPHQASFDDSNKLREMAMQRRKPVAPTGGQGKKPIDTSPAEDAGSIGRDGVDVTEGPGTKKPGLPDQSGGETKPGIPEGKGGKTTSTAPHSGSSGRTPANADGSDIMRTLDERFGKGALADLRDPDLNPDIVRDNYFHRDVQSSSKPKIDEMPAVKKSLPDVDSKQMNKLRANHAFAFWGVLNNSARVAEGVNDLRNGNYAEGGLKITANGLEGYSNASDLVVASKNLNNYKNGVKIAEEGAEQGLRGAKVLGKLAGGAMALYDGYQAADAFQSGNAVKGTEHSMDAVWDVAGMTGVGTAGALAHTLTRAAMSFEVGGVSGDKLVTSGMDSWMNSEVNDRAQARSERDGRALSAFRGLNGSSKLHAAANNKSDFVSAMTGLQEKIGSTSDAGERQRLISELREMKAVQSNVRGYNASIL